MTTTLYSSREHGLIATRIEKLRGHHHLLLLTRVCIWSLSLIHQVEEVGLVSSCILMTDTTCRTDSVVTYARRSSAECA